MSIVGPGLSNSARTRSSGVGDRRPPTHVHRLALELNDSDQARVAFAKLYGECTFEPSLGMPVSYNLGVTAYGSTSVTVNHFGGGGEVRVHALNDVYTLACAAAGTVEGEQAGEDFSGVPGRGYLLFSPGLRGSIRFGAGHRADNITIERSALDAHFTLLTGERRGRPFCFDVTLNVAQPRTLAIAGIAALFRQEIDRAEPSLPALAAMRDALFTAILTGAIHDARERLAAPVRRVAPACVRRVEDYIDAHASEPISLEDLVAVAGVPARSLYASFQRFRGTTPMTVLRQRRLELARQRLLDEEKKPTVIEVVRELGLGHAGRFSIEYKERFGESPSETIARFARR